MHVRVDIRGPVDEPYLEVCREHVLEMTLGPGSMEAGLTPSTLRRITFDGGVIGLCPAQHEHWIGQCAMAHLTMTVSDEALVTATDGAASSIELHPQCQLVDARLRALATAVEAERAAGFPSGRLFLDSIEQAVASALVAGYAVRDHPIRVHRGGLSRRMCVSSKPRAACACHSLVAASPAADHHTGRVG